MAIQDMGKSLHRQYNKKCFFFSFKFVYLLSFRMKYEQRNEKKEMKEAACFAAMEKRKSQDERKVLEEKENI